jgi:cell division protein FtsB
MDLVLGFVFGLLASGMYYAGRVSSARGEIQQMEEEKRQLEEEIRQLEREIRLLENASLEIEWQ